MKTFTLKAIVALLLLASLPCERALAADGRLLLPDFSALEDKASEVVDVNLNTALLGLAARFLDDKSPDEVAVKQLVAGLTGIYVKSFAFDGDFAYPKADIEVVRKQLSVPGWQKLVEVRSRKEQTHVDVYLSLDGDKVNGLAILASEPRQFTIVNIVGSVDLRKLHQLEGRFGVPDLRLEGKPPTVK
ncbi:MAG: DUF4252 domain-containing protein [Gammaproteobacteria bacterium]